MINNDEMMSDEVVEIWRLDFRRWMRQVAFGFKGLAVKCENWGAFGIWYFVNLTLCAEKKESPTTDNSLLYCDDHVTVGNRQCGHRTLADINKSLFLRTLTPASTFKKLLKLVSFPVPTSSLWLCYALRAIACILCILR